MIRNALWLVVIIIVLAAAWAWWPRPSTDETSIENAPSTITHPELNAILYPLYSGADWDKPQTESVVIGTTTYAGASVASASVSAGSDPASVFTPFEQYYEKKLQAAGWTIADDLAAGGHVGGQAGYRKGGDIVLTRFHIDYHTAPENAPSECPCDVTLSLFSTAEQ
jgi:hypothetical protein